MNPKTNPKIVSSTTKTSPIERLPPEILSEIVKHLRSNKKNNNIFSLLFVCKSFHHAAYPWLWHTFQARPREHTARADVIDTDPQNRPFRRGLRGLVDIINDIGVDAVGFRYTKALRFLSPDFDDGRYSVWSTTGLLDMVCDLIEAGKIVLRSVDLERYDRVRPVAWDPSSHQMIRFLKLLKEYSKLNWPSKPQITIRRYWDFYRLVLPLTEWFALECITTLKIMRYTDVPLSGDTKESTIETIRTLTAVLTGTKYLRYLKLSGPAPWTATNSRDCGCKIEELRHELDRLQGSINGLKYLYKLKLAYLLFHPSFFVYPPENVKRLVLTQTVSFGWWAQFAQYEFPGVEDLVMCPRTLRVMKPPLRNFEKYQDLTWTSGWCSTDDLEDLESAEEEGFVFMLQHLSLRDLKRLQTSHKPHYYYTLERDCYRPRDFLDLILENNLELEEGCRERYLGMNEKWRVKELHGGPGCEHRS